MVVSPSILLSLCSCYLSVRAIESEVITLAHDAQQHCALVFFLRVPCIFEEKLMTMSHFSRISPLAKWQGFLQPKLGTGNRENCRWRQLSTPKCIVQSHSVWALDKTLNTIPPVQQVPIHLLNMQSWAPTGGCKEGWIIAWIPEAHNYSVSWAGMGWLSNRGVSQAVGA